MTITAYLGATKLEPGQSNAHVTVNESMDVFDKAIAGRLALALVGGTRTLTGPESTNAILHITSTTVACAVTVQAVPKCWTVINAGTNTVTLLTAGQASPPTIAPGACKQFVCDGAIVRLVG